MGEAAHAVDVAEGPERGAPALLARERVGEEAVVREEHVDVLPVRDRRRRRRPVALVELLPAVARALPPPPLLAAVRGRGRWSGASRPRRPSRRSGRRSRPARSTPGGSAVFQTTLRVAPSSRRQAAALLDPVPVRAAEARPVAAGGRRRALGTGAGEPCRSIPARSHPGDRAERGRCPLLVAVLRELDRRRIYLKAWNATGPATPCRLRTAQRLEVVPATKRPTLRPSLLPSRSELRKWNPAQTRAWLTSGRCPRAGRSGESHPSPRLSSETETASYRRTAPRPR